VSRPKPVLLLILDGWGHREARDNNAIALANAPNWHRLLAQYPHTLVQTHGHYVGLPDEQMGNSEVGHMNIGAGRIVYQDLTRIDAAIADGSFFQNAALLSACAAARKSGGMLHVFGLLSPGGVHSSVGIIVVATAPPWRPTWPRPATAAWVKRKMSVSETMLFLDTQGAEQSRWMCWELGWFDGKNGHVAVPKRHRRSASF